MKKIISHALVIGALASVTAVTWADTSLKPQVSSLEAVEIVRSKVEGHITELELEHIRTHPKYEIDVRAAEEKHEFDIDATTGEITARKMKLKDAKKDIPNDIIPIEKAINIALEKEKDGIIEEVSLKQKIRGWVYKVDVINPQQEKVKMRIDATSGEIVEFKTKSR